MGSDFAALEGGGGVADGKTEYKCCPADGCRHFIIL